MKDSVTPFRRIRLLRLGFLALGALIVVQLFRVQVLSHAFYAALASGQHDLFRTLFPERGRIYAEDARTGQDYPLATNQKLSTVFAEPYHMKDPKKAADALAPILGLDAADLRTKLTEDPAAQYRALKKMVSDDDRAKIEALKLDGVGFSDEDYRFYPEGASGAQLLGFVRPTDDGAKRGQYGIEGYFDAELSGEQGFLDSEKDPVGRIIAIGRHDVKPAKDGDDVVLTVDRTVEYVVCSKLDAWVQAHGAERGSVVVLDPKTGAVIAMCDAPSFDPNAYGKADSVDVYNNTAIFAPYEPGSVFKTLTMAAALDTGKIAPSSTFDDPGEVKIGPYTIRNADLKAHGVVDMTTILAMSLNTGIVDVVGRVGPDVFRKYVQDFGFGERTGIELQTEAAGDVSSLAKKGDIWSATGAFGQGVSATVLQLASAYAAIADDGILMRPTVVKEIRHQGGVVDRTLPKEVRRVISSRTAKLLTGMLVAVVEKGEGKRAKVPGYWIAGKTGTAQIPRTDGPGYEVGPTIGTFAGFGPMEDPKFAMVVRIDRPKDVQFAESSAAPLFGDIAKYLLDYYEVPQTRR